MQTLDVLIPKNIIWPFEDFGVQKKKPPVKPEVFLETGLSNETKISKPYPPPEEEPSLFGFNSSYIFDVLIVSNNQPS